ncbi:RNA polymerase B [Rhizina undulata]
MANVGSRRDCTYETYIAKGYHRQPAASETLDLKDFTNSSCITHSEASHMITYLLTNRRIPAPRNDSFLQVQRYFTTFARVKDTTMLYAVNFFLRTKQKEWKLANFERAQLGNLFPRNAEEAKTVIPSIKKKIPDAELDEILKELEKLRGFGWERMK